MNARSFGRLVGCLCLCLGVGIVGSLSTRPEIPTWYAALNKPWWTPPPIAFPVVWTVLYVMMAIALWRLWDRAAPSRARRQVIDLFIVQLALNAIWSPLFFAWHDIRTALVVIILLLIAIVVTIVSCRRVDPLASWWLVPYALWVTYASTLNAGIALMN